jgi:hypothetical protein
MRLEGPANEPGLGETLLTAMTRRGGWRVREIALVEPGLEQIFLAATKQSEDPLATFARPRQ